MTNKNDGVKCTVCDHKWCNSRIYCEKYICLFQSATVLSALKYVSPNQPTYSDNILSMEDVDQVSSVIITFVFVKTYEKLVFFTRFSFTKQFHIFIEFAQLPVD